MFSIFKKKPADPLRVLVDTTNNEYVGTTTKKGKELAKHVLTNTTGSPSSVSFVGDDVVVKGKTRTVESFEKEIFNDAINWWNGQK